MRINEQRVLNLIQYCTARGFEENTLLRGTRVRARDLRDSETSTDVMTWRDFNHILGHIFSRLPQPEFSAACQSLWTQSGMRHWVDLARLEPMPFRFFIELLGDAGLCFEDARLTIKVIGHSKYQLRCQVNALENERLAFPFIKMIESELEAFARETGQPQTKIRVSYHSHFADFDLRCPALPANFAASLATKLSAPFSRYRLGLQVRQLHHALRALGRTMLVTNSRLRTEVEQRGIQAHIATALLSRSKSGLIQPLGSDISIQCPVSWIDLLNDLESSGGILARENDDHLVGIRINGKRFQAWLAGRISEERVQILGAGESTGTPLQRSTKTDQPTPPSAQYVIEWLTADETLGLVWPITQKERRRQVPETLVNALIGESVFSGGACVFDDQGDIKWSNDGFRKVFNLDGSEFKHSLKTLLSPALISRQLDSFYRDFSKRPLIDGLPIRLPIDKDSKTNPTARPLDQGIPSTDLKLWARVIELDHRLLGLAVFEDRSDDALLKSRIAELESKVEHLESRVSAGDAALGLAHDLGNLLTVARSQIQQVRSKAPASEAARLLEQSVEDSQSITRELLAFGKVSTRSNDLIDIDLAIRKSLPLFRHALPHRVTLEYQGPIESRPASTNMPESTLRNILLNLIINARDAISGPGIIALSVRSRANEIEIDIKDSGHGIDPQLQEHIFEGFHTSKAQGHGLGLANVRDMTRRYSGDLELLSSTSSGSHFRIILPASGMAVTFHRAEQAPSILIIDPDRRFSTKLQSALEARGAQVEQMASGADGAAFLARRHVYLDALVMELVLADPGGHALLEQAEALLPDQPVFIVSAHLETPFGQLPQSELNLQTVQKPVNVESLANWVIESIKPKPSISRPAVSGRSSPGGQE